MSLFFGPALLLLIYGSFTVDGYITNQLQAAVEAYEYPVTTTTASLGQLFDGCYSDQEGVLRKPGFRKTLNKNNNAVCAKICQEKGFAIAATQGTSCYCENTLPLPRLYENGDKYAAGNGGPCSTVCPGVYNPGKCRGDECCGGKKAYSVYFVGEIDVLRLLLYQVMDNFRDQSSRLLRSLLTPEELEKLKCNCYNGELSVIATGRSLTSSGRSNPKTLKLTWGSATSGETLREITKPSGLEETSLKLRSLNKLLESDEIVAETPFTDWDIMCDNLNGGGTLDCEEHYSKTTGFTETWTTEHGFNIQVTVGTEVEAGALFAKATAKFELSTGYSFTSGYTKSKSEETTEAFSFTATANPGTKVEVRFYKSEIPVSVKWRATVFADGYVLLSFGNILEKKLHLSQVLTNGQRELFAFGTLNYGKRKTVVGRTKMVDRNGKIIRKKPVKAM